MFIEKHNSKIKFESITLTLKKQNIVAFFKKSIKIVRHEENYFHKGMLKHLKNMIF